MNRMIYILSFLFTFFEFALADTPSIIYDFEDIYIIDEEETQSFENCYLDTSGNATYEVYETNSGLSTNISYDMIENNTLVITPIDNFPFDDESDDLNPTF